MKNFGNNKPLHLTKSLPFSIIDHLVHNALTKNFHIFIFPLVCFVAITGIIIALMLLVVGIDKKWSLIIISITLGLCLLMLKFGSKPSQENLNKNDRTILSPCNGKVYKVLKNRKYIEEYSSKNSTKTFNHTRIVTLLDLTNKHVVTSPVNGIIKNIKKVDGKFEDIFDKNHGKNNEHMIHEILSNDGYYVYVITYGGITTRRLFSNVGLNQIVKQGQELGMVRLSSRVDILIPNDFKVELKENNIIDNFQEIASIYNSGID